MSQINSFKAMLERGQDSEMLRMTLGSAYFKEGDMVRAVEHLQKAVEMKPDYSAAWKMLGRSLAAAGRLVDAIIAFDQGLQAVESTGDKQTGKEIAVFRRRVQKQLEGDASVENPECDS